MTQDLQNLVSFAAVIIVVTDPQTLITVAKETTQNHTLLDGTYQFRQMQRSPFTLGSFLNSK